MHGEFCTGFGVPQISSKGGNMSYQKLLDSLEIAKKRPYYFIKGETPKEVIIEVERLIGFKLSIQHEFFYSKVGYLSFSGYEFYGICDHKLHGKDVLCAIETTLNERKKYKLPERWIIFCSFDDGYMGYLDYSNLNQDGEPPIIMAFYDGKKFAFVKKISDDIGSYINKCLEYNK